MWRRLNVKKSSDFTTYFTKKLASLCHDMEKSVTLLGGCCFHFPATKATVSDMLEWFRTEVQAPPTAFAESNQNITCFAVAGVLRMLAGVECGHLSELKKVAISCNTSLLHNVPDDLAKIAGTLVRNWWSNHGLPYCIQQVEEENQVSFALIPFVG
jgi:hypothetical protein